MKLFFSVCFALLSLNAVSQKPNFFIEGKISLLSKAQYILIQPAESKDITIKINKDGSFKGSGFIKRAETAHIKTDSSYSGAIWAEPGRFKMVCEEIKYAGNGFLFRIPNLKGPSDASIFNEFNQGRYSIKSEESNSAVDQHKEFAISYIENIFKTRPDSKVLPLIIKLSKPFIGDVKAEQYFTLLSSDQLKEDASSSILTYFKIKRKIEKEKFFIDFQMMDFNGNPFQLSKMKAKIILIDFWTSDCSPCRTAHKGYYADLYKKFHSKGFEIVSISLDKKKEIWLDAIKEDSMIWINVSDLNGWNTNLAREYYINGVPTHFWIDGERKIFIDGITMKQIEEILNK